MDKDSTKIPATVITGFLGAGKTTLIRNLLATAKGRRIALIVNEFGDIGVDGEVLKGCGIKNCSDDDIVELSNGCICCTVADDFIPTMEKLLERGERPDHIVIETSGLALPQPLVAAFNWPEIRERVTVDGVITVADSRAIADGRFADDVAKLEAQRLADDALDHDSPLEELFEDQLICADMIILSKTDLVDDKALETIEGDIAGQIGRAVKIIRAENGNVPAAVLLGLEAATQNDIANRKSHHEKAHDAFHAEHGEDAQHEHLHDHDHDEFESFAVKIPPLASADNIAAALKPIIEAHDILRLKGFAQIKDRPMRLVVQAVGNRIETYFDREWGEAESRVGHLVVIGLSGLDRQGITKALTEALGADSATIAA